MARTKPAEQRRADLLVAGRELFLAKGVAATSLAEITARAGTSKGLFYLYFGSKDDLVAALQDDFATMCAERIRAAADAQPDWAAKLDAAARAGYECYQQSAELHAVLFRYAGGDDDHDNALVTVFRELLTSGVAAGAYRVEDPASTAVLCYTLLHAFDAGLSEAREPEALLRATQTLLRRAVGVLR